MTYPGGPQVTADNRVVMVALARIGAADQAERLSDIQAGQVFWARNTDAPYLISSGLAAYAPAGTPWPLSEPPWSARGVAVFGSATTNSSH
jgi:hypothetical protein